jgi:hypothetical protein
MKSASSIIALALFGVLQPAQAAEQGVTTGMVSFGGFKGDARNIKPGITVWNGTFVGVGISDTRKGILHQSAWECDAEVVSANGTVYKADGFCHLTDADGDTVNLVFERTDLPGGTAELKTKGTYISGTGKYVGITGHYLFSCKSKGADLCTATGGDYKIP